MLLRATQFNGGAEEPLQWGNAYITEQFMAFALKKSSKEFKVQKFKCKGENLRSQNVYFYDKCYQIVFVVVCIIKTALYMHEILYLILGSL